MLLGAAIFFLLVHLYHSLRLLLSPWLALPAFGNPVQIHTLALMLFSLCHASYVLGWRLALSFAGICAVVSWIFEQVGVATGAIYGAYHYSEKLGVRLGHVPLLIPIAWFAMAYASYMIANLIATGQAVVRDGGAGRLVWLTFLSAAVMTGWDLPMDPLMSSRGNWIWEQGGPYFGVPLQNYVGWMLTTFTFYLIYRRLERARGPRPEGGLGFAIMLMPVLAYSAFTVVYVVIAEPAALRIIACYSMGLPALIAAARAYASSRA